MTDTKTREHRGSPQLGLDFANTGLSDSERAHLASYAGLVRWGERAGALAPDDAGSLLQEAARRPGDAQAILGRALGLRDALLRIFTAVAEGDPPEPDDLAVLNAALGRAQSHRRVVFAAEDFHWEWDLAAGHLDRMLWPVAVSAAELLTEGDLTRVKRCADDSCGWLFIDTSRNRSRRWCDMSDCGNRAKARRFYRRQRAAGASDHE